MKQGEPQSAMSFVESLKTQTSLGSPKEKDFTDIFAGKLIKNIAQNLKVKVKKRRHVAKQKIQKQIEIPKHSFMSTNRSYQKVPQPRGMMIRGGKNFALPAAHGH